MDGNPTLRRFWFQLKEDRGSRLGYGVTAWTKDDAIASLSGFCWWIVAGGRCYSGR
jgi:hypothetical protein